MDRTTTILAIAAAVLLLGGPATKAACIEDAELARQCAADPTNCAQFKTWAQQCWQREDAAKAAARAGAGYRDPAGTRDGAACPPSYRMTERDGCQPVRSR